MSNQLKQQYIKAIQELLEENRNFDEVTKNAKEVMARRGHLQLWPGVLNSLTDTLSRSEKISAPRLIVAKKEDAESYKDIGSDAKIEIDPSLIGGYIYQKGYTRTDNSYKSRLLNWYRKSIKS